MFFLYRTDMVNVSLLHICGKVTCLCIHLSSDRKLPCTHELCFISRLLLHLSEQNLVMTTIWKYVAVFHMALKVYLTADM